MHHGAQFEVHSTFGGQTFELPQSWSLIRIDGGPAALLRFELVEAIMVNGR